jgi:hypothetical protein
MSKIKRLQHATDKNVESSSQLAVGLVVDELVVVSSCMQDRFDRCVLQDHIMVASVHGDATSPQLESGGTSSAPS